MKNRHKWDISLRVPVDQATQENPQLIDQQMTYDVDYTVKNYKPGVIRKSTQFKCKLYRKLIEYYKTYIITEIAESDAGGSLPPEFKLNEAIIISQYPRVPGKTIVFYYSKLTAPTLSRSLRKKFAISRMTNLAIAKDFIKNERCQDMSLRIQKEELSAQKKVADGPTNPEGIEAQGFPKHRDSWEEDMKEQQQKIQEIQQKEQRKGFSLVNPHLHEEKRRKQPRNEGPLALFWNREDSDIDDESTHVSKNREKIKRLIWRVDELINGRLTIPGLKLEQRKPGYRRAPEGGIECFNREELRTQDGLILELMKTVGKTLIEGKNVVSISLPVRIFEPRSTLERVCDFWAFGPIYLNRAAHCIDPLERFKNVVTFAIAGLHNPCKQLKPFNPILGETYQATWADGSEIFLEHTSHHPPISNFLVTIIYPLVYDKVIRSLIISGNGNIMAIMNIKEPSEVIQLSGKL